MRVHGEISLGGTRYAAGDEVPAAKVYPLFLLHMGIFGASGFFLAYSDPGAPLAFLWMHGAFAILVYLVFYLAIFGLDEVRWMVANAALGLLGIYTEIDWLLGLTGRHAADFSWARHAIPFGYYVLYTFLLRHMVVDALSTRADPVRRRRVEAGYVWVSALSYLALWLWRR